MQVVIENLSRKFHHYQVFHDINLILSSGEKYAITGNNGSGKSTLVKIIAGYLSPTEGEISYFVNNYRIEREAIYHYLSLCAPYVELIEEFTLREMLVFHGGFNTYIADYSVDTLLDISRLSHHADKPLKYFSSGMLQRVKLLLALLTDVPMVLLDEPTTNLDKAGIAWYRSLVENHSAGRLLVISSNQAVDFDFCDKFINLMDYKK